MINSNTFQLTLATLVSFLCSLSSIGAIFNPTDVATLIAAINIANGNTQPDVINLGSNTFVFLTPDNGDNGLPIISDDGPGNSITIQNGTLSRDSSAPLLRFLQVSIDGELILQNVVLENGLISGEGGAVLNFGSLKVQRSTFQNNEVTSGTGGGAIYNFSLLQVEFSTFQNNAAGLDGGAIFNDSSAIDMTVFSSTFFANTSDTGAAIANVGPASLIANSTFSENNGTGPSGALYNGGTITTLSNNTVTKNDSPGTGGSGGLYNFASGTITNLISNIIAKNTAGENPDYANYGVITNASSNLIGVDVPTDPGNHTIINGVNGNQVGTVANPIDPLLGPLANLGGPTQVHPLLPGSPAINTGANPESFANDQRGPPFLRTVGGQTDIGSFESQTSDGTIVFTPTTTEELIAAVEFANATDIPVVIDLGGRTFNLEPSLLVSMSNMSLIAPRSLPVITGRITMRNGTLNKVAALSNQNLTIAARIRGSMIRVGQSLSLIKQVPRKGRLTLSKVTLRQSLSLALSINNNSESLRALVADPLNDNGGAVHNMGVLEVEDATFRDFEVFGDGGAIYNDPSAESLSIRSSTFNNNQADLNGGAVSSDGPISFILNSTFSSNNALQNGGALYNGNGLTTLDNNTIYKNSAHNGGGIFNAGTIEEFISNIVAGNKAKKNCDIANEGTIDENEFNLIGRDPLLGPLADNGGPTQTHALLRGSPALDAGSNPNFLRFDQRGPNFLRTVRKHTDIGSYECQSGCDARKPDHDDRHDDDDDGKGRRSHDHGGWGGPQGMLLFPPPAPVLPPVLAPPVVQPAAPVIVAPDSGANVPPPVAEAPQAPGPAAGSVESNETPSDSESASGCLTTTGSNPLMLFVLIVMAMRLRARRKRNLGF